MRRHQFDRNRIVNDHLNTLRNRLERAADAKERILLQKRLNNLQNVLEFLASTHGSRALGSRPEFDNGHQLSNSNPP